VVSSPKPPDPEKTAAAQAGLNRDTAITQAQLNQVNQITPDGNLTYAQTGTSRFKDSKGNWVETPTYTATTTLSPQQQAIKTQTDAASLNLGTLANQQSAAIKDQLSKPFQFTNDDASNWAYDLASQRILPQQEKNAAALRSQLIASGVRPGTAAYDSEMARLTNANTDQLNQLALTGRQQAYQEQLSQYNNPINTISALMSGSQVQNPNFVNTPQSQVGGVDYTGLVNSNYQAKVQSQNAMLGGLFGLGAGIVKAIPWSDRRLKKDIIEIGEKNGLPWYGFRYIWDDAISPLRYGFMADDVMEVMPQAVEKDPSGFYKVDYDMAMGDV
jgi:hypothetical protein